MFDYEESVNAIEEPDLGDAWIPEIAGRKKFTATIVCKFDETDSTGQEVMSVGSSVSLQFLPYGTGTGAQRKTVSCMIRSVGVAFPEGDGYVRRTFTVASDAAAGVTNDTLP